jgi:hypothetical protein
MRKVTFAGISQYDSSYIRGAMQKHHTSDPEEALKKEHVSYTRFTTGDYPKVEGMKRICAYFIAHDFFKYVYLDEANNKPVVLISDRRSTCVCQ